MNINTHKQNNHIPNLNFTDLDSLPKEASLYLSNCLLSIKQDIDFVSNYQEIYNFRPEFNVHFINSTNKKEIAFAHSDKTYHRCFIYISIGLIFTIYNIVYEALLLEPKFLSTYFSNECNHLNKNSIKKIKKTTLSPTSIDSLIERFCQYNKAPLAEDMQTVIDGVVQTAISFICKHEMAHFFRTHFTFSYNSYSVTCFEEGNTNHLFNVDSTRTSRDSYMRAIESDADTQATIMALRELESILSKDYTIDQISQREVLDIYYEFCLAVGILFLYLDPKTDFKYRRIGTHPPSIVRLQNIMYIMKVYFETIYHIDSDAILEEQMAILFELENLAILMDHTDGLWIRSDSPQYNNCYLDIDSIDEYWRKTYPDMLDILNKIDKHALYDFINLNLS